MNEHFWINKIYKKLEYACYLCISKSKRNLEHVSCRNWEIINYSDSPDSLHNTFINKYPTLFHYTFSDNEYNNSLIDYIDFTNKTEGWSKRFLCVYLSNCNTISERKILSLAYTRIDDNLFIHNMFVHYINRK